MTKSYNELDQFFSLGQTRDLKFRLNELKKLRQLIKDRQNNILKALKQDLGKPALEAYASEIAFVIDEIRIFEKHLKDWAQPQRVSVPLLYQPGKAMIRREPFGKVLIIAPWNYPFQLLVSPLIGALAAGNVCAVKASELAPHTAEVMKSLFNENFEPGLIQFFSGGPDEAQSLLQRAWDFIFFTGSTSIGRLVYQAASQHLTPVALELGGKSPALLDESADLEVSLRRILWAKFFNCGQTCVAPDYLLIPKRLRVQVEQTCHRLIKEFYGAEAKQSPDYGRIVSQKHFDRIVALLTGADVRMGGQHDSQSFFIEPTLVWNPDKSHPLRREEIFGPILPIIPFETISEALTVIEENPKPLALYLFTKNDELKKRINEQVDFGGAAINDCITHLAISDLPFGGVGPSGMGRYHGRASFDLFTYEKSILDRGLWPDPRFRYPPYKNKLAFIKRLLG